MRIEKHQIKSDRIREAGFSLLELMVSMIIFLIFMSAVYGLLKIGNVQKSAVSTQTEVAKNVRMSLNTIGRDAVNAGLGYSRVGGYAPDDLTNLRMSLPSDPDISHDLITAIVAGNEINNNVALTTGKSDVVSFAFRDLDFNDGNPIKLSSATDFGSNGVVITTPANAAFNSKQFDLYLISDGTRTALGLVTSVPNSNTLVFEIGAADPLGINALYTGSKETRSKLVSCDDEPDGCIDYSTATAKKVQWVSYELTLDGVLTRTTYGNNTNQPAAEQIRVQQLAYNIQNLQVKYLLNDGVVSDDPSNGGLDQDRLNDVVQIEVTVSASYTVSQEDVIINKVVDLKSTFSTKNLGYDIG